MANKPPAFQLYAQDFLTGVVYLTNEEIGIYVKMLCKQWTDGKIPIARLHFLVGKSWGDLSDELKNKFKTEDVFLFNERLEIERKKMCEKSKKAKKSAQARWNNDAMRTHNKRIYENDAIIEDEIEDEDEIENEIEIYPAFDDFWELYDKKVGKQKAEKKWDALSQKQKEEIMDYVPNYIISKPDKQFRKDPERFITNKTWKDEILTNGQQTIKNTGATAEYRAKTAQRLGVKQS